MKLYIYDHCPFCVRARMIFGLKNIPVEQIIIDNDDEPTPVGLVGKKVVPILVKKDGTAMPESLDIVRYVDQHFGNPILSEIVRPEIEDWIKTVGSYYNRLLCPRFIKLPLAEFNKQSAVDYFVKKKTESLGDFAENLANSQQYIDKLQQDLVVLDNLIKADDKTNGVQLSIEDIMLFPMLRNLTCVKGVSYPQNVASYVEKMAKLTGIELYWDVAV